MSNNFFFDVQQQLAKNILFDVAYVGNTGVKLQGFLNGNQKNPSLGFARPYANWPSDITEGLNGFKSNYNSLQARYEQQAIAGLTLLGLVHMVALPRQRQRLARRQHAFAAGRQQHLCRLLAVGL